MPDDDNDKILSRIKQLLGMKPPGGESDDDGAGGGGGGSRGGDGRVPAHRLREVTQQNAQLRQALEELQQQHTTALEQLRADAAQQVQAVQQQFEHERGLLELGVKDRGSQRVLREEWAAMDEKGRPDTPAAMLQSWRDQQKAHTDDPKKHEAPALAPHLTPFLEGGAADGAGGGRAPGRGAGGPPRLDRGTRNTNPESPLEGYVPKDSGEWFQRLGELDRAAARQ